MWPCDTFFVVARLARVLGPEGYGQVNLAMAALSFGSVLGDLGLQTVGIRTIAQGHHKLSEVVSSIVALRLSLSACAFGLVALFALISSQSGTVKLLTVLFAANLLLAGTSINWVFTGIQEMGSIGIAGILQTTVYAILVFLLVRHPGKVLLLPLVSGAGQLTATVFLWLAFHRRQPAFCFAPLVRQWRTLLREALPLGTSQLITMVYISFPVLLLGWVQGEAATGYYGGAYRLMQVIHQLLGLFFVTLYPVAAYRWNSAPEAVPAFLNRVLKLILALSLPVALGAMVVGPALVVAVLGPRFASSGLPFQILLWNVVLIGINGVYMQLVLLMKGHQREFLRGVALGAVISVALNLLLTSAFSFVGTALAWVFSELVVCIAGYWYTRHLIQLDFWPLFLRPFVAASIMTLGCWLLTRVGLSLWAVVPLGAVLYGLLLLGVRGIDSGDWDFVRTTLLKRGVPSNDSDR